MPSPNPRLSVVITPVQYRLLTRLALLQGRSQASYVRRLLDLATPRLNAILEPLERSVAEEEAYDEDFETQLAADLEDAEGDMVDQLDMLEPLELAAELSAPPGRQEDGPDSLPPRTPHLRSVK